MICIWCKTNHHSPSREHIIPEALGGNEEVVLQDAACSSCNNKLGHIDRALVKQFEIIAFMNGILGKKRRKPAISSWAALSGSYSGGQKEIHLNAGPGIIQGNKKVLPPANKVNGIHSVGFDADKQKVTFKQDFGNDPKFLPALYKIGLNLVAKYYGASIAAGAEYDHVRHFVLGDADARQLTAAMDHSNSAGLRSGFSAPLLPETSSYPLFQVEILGVSFLLDLHPEQKSLETIRGAATLTGVDLYVFPLKACVS
jgi:hypothetical protein